MKKMMFLAAAAVVVLSGCVKSEDVDLGGKKAIGFKAFNEVAARGPIEGTAYPTDGKFVVFSVLDNGSTAYFDPTVFSDGDSNSEWSGETPRYWPSTGVLDFAAYHPASLEGDVTPTYSGGIASIKIENIDNKADQDDIMFSNLVNDADCAAHATQPLVFNHALAWIEVHVKADNNLFEVTNLTLNNTVQGGTLTITPAATSTAAWSDLTAGVNMPIVAAATAVPTGAAAPIGKSVLVVPGNQTSIDLTYTLDGVEITHPTITLSNKWEMGKKYIYTISFGANEITFTPTVVDSWKTPESINGGTI